MWNLVINLDPGVYDKRITEGMIGVVITLDDESRKKDAEDILKKSGAFEVKYS